MDNSVIRDIPKWVLTFVMLFATLWWGKFCIETAVSFIQASQISGLEAVLGLLKGAIEGAMITWMGLMVQFWFRKKPSEGG
jgi:hypothetical protein